MANREEMRKAGFLEFEINALAPNIPPDVPYFLEMVTDRAILYADAMRQGLSDSEWEWHIKKLYQEYEWYDKDEDPDAWQLLRSWEGRYRDKHPDWESPSEKKKKKQDTDFPGKYAKGLEAYEKGRGR